MFWKSKRVEHMSSAVSLRQVIKHYRRGKESVEVLHGLNLEIPEGEFVSLMGPSGSGKTTILNLVGGSAGWWLALTTMIGCSTPRSTRKP